MNEIEIEIEGQEHEGQEHEPEHVRDTGRGGSASAIRGVLNRAKPDGLAHWGGPRPGTTKPQVEHG